MAQIDVKDDMTQEDFSADSTRRLRFVGTVELGGAVTGQMLGILFGPDSNVDGQLQFEGPVEIAGTYRGAIKTSDTLKIGEHAIIEANINCGSATVKGQVNGNITARDFVALEPGARVKGDITAPALSMAKGATFDGVSKMGTVSSSPNKTKKNGRQPYTP
jgi:cytoskeletal protein CcmA (bactofilin family)